MNGVSVCSLDECQYSIRINQHKFFTFVSLQDGSDIGKFQKLEEKLRAIIFQIPEKKRFERTRKWFRERFKKKSILRVSDFQKVKTSKKKTIKY